MRKIPFPVNSHASIISYRNSPTTSYSHAFFNLHPTYPSSRVQHSIMPITIEIKKAQPITKASRTSILVHESLLNNLTAAASPPVLNSIILHMALCTPKNNSYSAQATRPPAIPFRHLKIQADRRSPTKEFCFGAVRLKRNSCIRLADDYNGWFWTYG